MENTLLIGLSRQMTLERQIDVISNNIANMNTNGFKADKSLFQEYLMPGARADNFVGKDRQFSFVLDRATWRDIGQGSIEQTGNPLDVALDGSGFLAVQTASGERYTRNGALQINAQGQLVTTDGSLVLGTAGPITFQPNDHDIIISGDRHHQRAPGQRAGRFSARPAADRQFRPAAAAAEGRGQPAVRPRRRHRPGRPQDARCARARSSDPMSAR